jgi:flagellar biosynthesis anti-sigma factor FlgM
MINNDGKLGPVRGNAAVKRVAAAAEPATADVRRQHGPALQSSHLQIIALAQEVSRQAPPVDTARVAELRRAIAAGEYRIETVAIAQAMIARANGDSDR